MADVSPVLKRLEALTAVLERQPPETRIPVSDTQAQIVIDLLRGSRFAIGDLAQVAEAVAKSALTPVACMAFISWIRIFVCGHSGTGIGHSGSRRFLGSLAAQSYLRVRHNGTTDPADLSNIVTPC